MVRTDLSDTTQSIIAFVESIGIPVRLGKVPIEKQFVPGICIDKGGLLIELESLKYPGDILHEAGHLAVASPEKRALMDGVLLKDDQSDGEEMMAQTWSYAAATFIGIDPHIVFHEAGYRGGGANIVNNFLQGRFFAVCTLQWIGLTYEPKQAEVYGIEPYPHMIKWLRE